MDVQIGRLHQAQMGLVGGGIGGERVQGDEPGGACEEVTAVECEGHVRLLAVGADEVIRALNGGVNNTHGREIYATAVRMGGIRGPRAVFALFWSGAGLSGRRGNSCPVNAGLDRWHHCPGPLSGPGATMSRFVLVAVRFTCTGS